MLNIQELTERYNLKNTQTIRKFITRNLEKINKNGTHAFHDSNGWQFDETAVEIIDKLRGISEVAIVEREESERLQELENEVDNLKSLLLMTQNKLLQKQEELTESHKLLLQSEKKYLTAETTSKDYQADLRVSELKRENLEEKLLSAELRSKNLEDKLKNLQAEMDKIKKRGLIDRVFNNF